MKPVHMFELDDDIKATIVHWFQQQLREFSEGCISQYVNEVLVSLFMVTVLMASAPVTRTVPECASFEQP
jgi:hypothetical protein